MELLLVQTAVVILNNCKCVQTFIVAPSFMVMKQCNQIIKDTSSCWGSIASIIIFFGIFLHHPLPPQTHCDRYIDLLMTH
jgi:hypothetical protein